MRVLRFDDICINSNMRNNIDIATYANEKFGCRVLFCISPLVHTDFNERVYPKIFNAYSDFRHFFKVENLGIPEFPSWIIPASHGLFHIDHRLLTKEVQEVSILASCSLAKSKIFVPPFNKWNKFTEEICLENDINLVKFEDGWRCCEYNKYDPSVGNYYIHAREFTLESFKEWAEDL